MQSSCSFRSPTSGRRRLGCSANASVLTHGTLYLFGVKVSGGGDPDDLFVRSGSNAVVGYLRTVAPGSAYFTIEGPGLNDAKYALFRR